MSADHIPSNSCAECFRLRQALQEVLESTHSRAPAHYIAKKALGNKPNEGETDERYQATMRCAAIAERVCREHADPTAGYAAATAIRKLANATPLPSEEVSEMTGHPCDDGLRTAPCPGCMGKGCDYCNEGVQLRPAQKANEQSFAGVGPDDAEFGSAEWRRDNPESEL